jgi:hypothetical protein
MWLATPEGGAWANFGAESVVIPATIGLDHGVWNQVREGVRGATVLDEAGLPVVYVLCEPSSHYYQVMVRHEAWSRNGGTATRKVASTPAALTGGRRAVGA